MSASPGGRPGRVRRRALQEEPRESARRNKMPWLSNKQIRTRAAARADQRSRGFGRRQAPRLSTWV
jgi:hypothetical protein